MLLSWVSTILAVFGSATLAIMQEPPALTALQERLYWCAVVAVGLSALVSGVNSAVLFAKYRRRTLNNLLGSAINEICRRCGESNLSVRANFMKRRWYLMGRMTIYAAHGVFDWRERIQPWSAGQGCSGRALGQNAVVWADLTKMQSGAHQPSPGAPNAATKKWGLTRRQVFVTRSLSVIVSLRVIRDNKVIGVVNFDDVAAPEDSLLSRDRQETKFALEGLAIEISRQ